MRPVPRGSDNPQPANALKRLGDETKMSTEAPTNLYAKLDEVGLLAGKVTIIERVKVGMGLASLLLTRPPTALEWSAMKLKRGSISLDRYGEEMISNPRRSLEFSY